MKMNSKSLEKINPKMKVITNYLTINVVKKKAHSHKKMKIVSKEFN